MIRSLRVGHRALAAFVLVGGLGAVVVAVGSRSEPLSTALPGSEPTGAIAVDELGLELAVRPGPVDTTIVFVRSRAGLGLADPLLYATATLPTDSLLPEGAIALGPIGRWFGRGTPVATAGLASRPFLLVWSNGAGKLIRAVRSDWVKDRTR